MNKLLLLPLLLGLLLPSTAPAAARTGAPRLTAEWRPLFNGRDLDGWEQSGDGEFRVENGELVTHGGFGTLWHTREKLGDCQIRVVFRLGSSNANSGVHFRIPERPYSPWEVVNRGYEAQIAAGGGDWHGTGTLYSLTKALARPSTPPGQENEMIITLRGPRTRIAVNGVLITDYTEGQTVPPKNRWYEPDRGPRPRFGYIALQNHDENSRVYFRDVSVRALPREERRWR
ncbi:MAG TPA: DUF1080 domain-containing protein [Verrucomicrobiota bacterium]|nr:DUF1080 domain-containing protein [Verrucomicrobiota bacterium]